METNTFNPDVILGHSERGQVAATVGSEGYRIINRIMRSEVDRFILDLINTAPASEKEVYAKHILAKAAAQFYEAVTNRLNHEIMQYTGAIRDTAPPVDVTNGLLDIGPNQSTFDDLQNDELLRDDFLEEGNFDE